MAMFFLYALSVKAASDSSGNTSSIKKINVKLTRKNKIKKLKLKAGSRVILKVKYGKKKIAASKIRFSSSKKKVASVSADGIVTAKKVGTVRIKLKRKKKKQYATILITVIPRDPIQNIIIEDTEDQLYSEQALQKAPAAKPFSSQVSKYVGQHIHSWKPILVENYPAEYCTKCRIERWNGSEELQKEAVFHTDRKFIMIGDSYGARADSYGGNYTWPYQLCKLMGLGEERAIISAKGGFGFAARLSTTGTIRHFVDLLRLIEPDPDITDIIIVGGIGNDLNRTKEEIETGFLDFFIEARVRFPNARIIYAAPNTAVNNENRLNRFKERRTWYKSFCQLYGWIYLDGCENIIPQEERYFRSDGHHPNEEGEIILGEGLFKKLKPYL